MFAVIERFINNHDKNNQVTAQQPEKVVEIKIIPVRGNIYMLTGDVGNIGLCIGDDGVLMVDSKFAPLSTKIQDARGQFTTL